MAKILHDGDWYEQLSSEALYEEEYERILLAHAESLFPSYHLIPFKTTVYSEERGAKADFALVHRRYREWWVVEAELAHHSFEHHVKPQVEALSRAFYGESEAVYLHSHAAVELDLDRIRSMVKGVPPGVLIVVNAPKPDWARDLAPYRALVTVLEVFRSRYNKYLYRLNGEQPPDSDIQRSICTVYLSRMLKLHSPGILSVSHGEKMLVQYGGGLTEWCRVDLADSVYLTSAKPINLDPKRNYELVEREGKSFVLRAI